jgi:lipoyl(octanoyl) transferase
MQEAKDCISALVRQEDRYSCPDYLQAVECHGNSYASDLALMVEEFANVVTDHYHYSSSPKSSFIKSTSMKDVRDVDKVVVSTSSRISESFRFWRQQMFDWACMVVDSFGMDREIVAVSFALLDRYVANETASSTQEIARDDFQLYSMTCLYLAIKILEPYPRKIGVEALVDMSRGFYTEEDISVTEREILSSLSWHVNPPTALAFTRLLWTLFPNQVSSSTLMTSTTLTEIAVSDSFFIAHKASLVGLASVMIAARLHGISDRDVQHFLTNLEGVLPIRENPEFATVYRQLEVLYS